MQSSINVIALLVFLAISLFVVSRAGAIEPEYGVLQRDPKYPDMLLVCEMPLEKKSSVEAPWTLRTRCIQISKAEWYARKECPAYPPPRYVDCSEVF